MVCDEVGAVDDHPGLEYLNDHLSVLADAMDAGVPVKGCFAP